jgi:hypothetical protein
MSHTEEKGERKPFALPEVYNIDLDNYGNETNEEGIPQGKPWNNNRSANINDYFNYGFNEESWKHHTMDVKQNAT